MVYIWSSVLVGITHSTRLLTHAAWLEIWYLINDMECSRLPKKNGSTRNMESIPPTRPNVYCTSVFAFVYVCKCDVSFLAPLRARTWKHHQTKHHAPQTKRSSEAKNRTEGSDGMGNGSRKQVTFMRWNAASHSIERAPPLSLSISLSLAHYSEYIYTRIMRLQCRKLDPHTLEANEIIRAREFAPHVHVCLHWAAYCAHTEAAVCLVCVWLWVSGVCVSIWWPHTPLARFAIKLAWVHQ